MMSDIELTHRYLREAITDISEIIDKSEYVEYKLIKVKRKLIKAEYHFAGQYIAYLAERADIDINTEGMEQESGQRRSSRRCRTMTDSEGYREVDAYKKGGRPDDVRIINEMVRG